jgi:hypothetical protein
MYVLVPVANQRSGIDWEAEKGPFAERILAFLEAWGLEGPTQGTPKCSISLRTMTSSKS